MSDPQQDDVLLQENIDFATGEGQTPGPAPTEAGVRVETALAGPSQPEQRPVPPEVARAKTGLSRQMTDREMVLDEIQREKIRHQIQTEAFYKKDATKFQIAKHLAKRSARFLAEIPTNLYPPKFIRNLRRAFKLRGTSGAYKASIIAGGVLGVAAPLPVSMILAMTFKGIEGSIYAKQQRKAVRESTNEEDLIDRMVALQERRPRTCRLMREVFAGLAVGSMTGGFIQAGMDIATTGSINLDLPSGDKPSIQDWYTHSVNMTKQNLQAMPGEIGTRLSGIVPDNIENALGGMKDALGEKIPDETESAVGEFARSKYEGAQGVISDAGEKLLGSEKTVATGHTYEEPGLVDNVTSKLGEWKDNAGAWKDEQLAKTSVDDSLGSLKGNEAAKDEEAASEGEEAKSPAPDETPKSEAPIEQVATTNGISSFFSSITDRISSMFRSGADSPPTDAPVPQIEEPTESPDTTLSHSNTYFDRIPQQVADELKEAHEKSNELPGDQGHIADRDPKVVGTAAVGITLATIAGAKAIDNAGKRAIG